VKLTPVEIKNQEFKKVMRGYDTVEVDTFIELVADKYQELLNENERLAKQNIVYETELTNYKDVEKTLKQTLKNVQENSQMTKENSAKEAGLIKKEAELAAAQMLEKARLQVFKMKEEMVRLQNQKHSFISRLRHVLASQMELLDVLKTDDIDLRRIKDRSRPAAQVQQKTAQPANPPAAKNTEGAAEKKQQSDEKEEKTHGKDLFNDIFGENQEGGSQ